MDAVADAANVPVRTRQSRLWISPGAANERASTTEPAIFLLAYPPFRTYQAYLNSIVRGASVVYSDAVFEDKPDGISSRLGIVDARVKFLWTLTMMGLLAFLLDPVFYAGLTVYLLAIIAVAGVGFRELGGELKAFSLLFVITFLLHVIFTPPDGTTMFEVFGKEVTEGGLYLGLLYSYRVLLFLLVMTVSARTTSSIEMADGILRLIKPLRRIGVPVADISMMIFVALRFIPLLGEEIRAIKMSQVSRGMSAGKGPIAKVKAAIPVIVPLMLGSLRRAESLALAIESRGYRRGALRTSMIEFKLGRPDGIFVSAGVIAVAASILLSELAS